MLRKKWFYIVTVVLILGLAWLRRGAYDSFNLAFIFFILFSLTILRGIYTKSSNIGKFKKSLTLITVSLTSGSVILLLRLFLPKRIYLPVLFFGFFIVAAFSIIGFYYSLPEEKRKIRLFYKILLAIILFAFLFGLGGALLALINGNFY